MRKLLNWRTALLVLPLMLGAWGCILIPEIVDRIVELAVAASTRATFVSSGETNTHDDTDVVNLSTNVNLKQVLADNGVDVTDVKDVKLMGVSYRVTKPEAGRSITGGTVTIQRGAGPVTSLVTAFTASAASVTGWIPVALDGAGVGVINAILTALLDEAKTGTPATDVTVTYHVQGVSVPGADPTDFIWEFKLDLSIVGTVKVQVVN